MYASVLSCEVTLEVQCKHSIFGFYLFMAFRYRKNTLLRSHLIKLLLDKFSFNAHTLNPSLLHSPLGVESCNAVKETITTHDKLPCFHSELPCILSNGRI